VSEGKVTLGLRRCPPFMDKHRNIHSVPANCRASASHALNSDLTPSAVVQPRCRSNRNQIVRLRLPFRCHEWIYLAPFALIFLKTNLQPLKGQRARVQWYL
jgi:hypothetical protein